MRYPPDSRFTWVEPYRPPFWRRVQKFVVDRSVDLFILLVAVGLAVTAVYAPGVLR